MDSLHAPWRIEYILGPKKPSGDQSIFERIAASDDDEGHFVIARDRSCFAVLNRYPYNGGHLMVVPYKKTASLDGLTAGEMSGVMDLVRRCRDALEATMNPDGYNIGINLGRTAGACDDTEIFWRWPGIRILAADQVVNAGQWRRLQAYSLTEPI